GRLTGHVVAQEDDGTAVLDVAGVGYELTIPIGCLGRARQDAEGRTVLHVHTHATREEAMILYGFPSAEERQVFRTVIGVPNVGPKLALSILGALSVQELAAAIARKDLTRLTSISGVGKKTAERLLLELKDKLAHVPTASTTAPSMQAGHGGGKAEQLRSALANLGFRPNEVDRALDGLRDRLIAAELADLVREGLSLLRK
ncbi:MAG: Holliday junction branch migration protein RuvA, partial [Polyangiales bacterium]